MARRRHLTRAPITEGLIDFRVHTEGVAAADIEKAVAASSLDYKVVGPLLAGTLDFSLSADNSSPPPAQKMRPTGVRLHSTDEKYVALLTVEGFTVSRLAPYLTWEQLVQEARRLWPVYVAAVSPRSINRAAVRFINDLRLPLRQGEDFEEYVATQLLVPDPAFVRAAGFLLRYEGFEPEIDATVIFTQVLGGSTPTEASIILDIDAFRAAAFSVVGESAWEYLEQLRQLKNRIFFNLITEKCAELFE